MKINKWVLIFSFVLILLLMVFLGTRLGKKSEIPLPTPPFDWSVLPQKIDSKGTTLYENTQDYQIYFSPENNEYVIIIYGTPFEKAKTRAEEAFLKQFSLVPEEACRLNVFINTPYWANAKESEQTYSLSFCNNPSPTPQP